MSYKSELPIGRPKCCGKQMYAAGGTLDGSAQFWRCEHCGKEIQDILATEVAKQDAKMLICGQNAGKAKT